MAVQRRVIIGVIGGDGQMATSVALGRVIAQREWILLSGGQVLPRTTVELKGEAKDGSMLGAAEASPSRARLISILPARQRAEAVRWDYIAGGRRLVLHTGQPHYIRNVINGRTPDVLVVFGGSRGTLAEIAFANACGRPLLFSSDSLEMLRRKFRKYFGSRGGANPDLSMYFDQPLEAYPGAAGPAGNVHDLIGLLEQTLSDATEVDDLAAAVGAVIGGRDWRNEETGFPGLPGESGSKLRFEAIVQGISN